MRYLLLIFLALPVRAQTIDIMAMDFVGRAESGTNALDFRQSTDSSAVVISEHRDGGLHTTRIEAKTPGGCFSGYRENGLFSFRADPYCRAYDTAFGAYNHLLNNEAN